MKQKTNTKDSKINKLTKGIILLLLCLAMQLSTVSAAQNDASGITIHLINQAPDPAMAGEVTEIRLGVTSLGGASYNNLTIEMMPAYPFELAPGESAVKEIGTIGGYQGMYDLAVVVVKYQVKVNKDAVAGTYNLKIKYYVPQADTWIEKTIPIDVKSRESAEIIHIDQTLLVPGKITPLKFTINNVGNSQLSGLSFHWQNADEIILPVGSDNTRYIKYLDVGERAEIEYNVIADTNAVPGLYKMDLYLTYDDPLKNGTKTITTLAGIYVGGETDFDVAYSDSSAGQTSFSIANTGSNPAYSVSVIIPEQRGWSVTGSNSAIIGNLNKGDYTVASFSLQSSMNQTRTAGSARGFNSMNNPPQINNPRANDANNTGDGASGVIVQNQRMFNNSLSSSNNVIVQIAYTDTTGERKTVDKEVQVGAQSSASGTAAGTSFQRGAQQQRVQQGFFAKYLPYLIIMAVFALGVFAYTRYKGHKSLNPDFKIRDLLKRRKKQK